MNPSKESKLSSPALSELGILSLRTGGRGGPAAVPAIAIGFRIDVEAAMTRGTPLAAEATFDLLGGTAVLYDRTDDVAPGPRTGDAAATASRWSRRGLDRTPG
jgi:hypothetical protein